MGWNLSLRSHQRRGTRIRRRHFIHRRGYPPPGYFYNIWDGNVGL
jgi:hypothetical protein